MNKSNGDNARIFDESSNILRGCLMGCADVVPGVSGGTVALILGIYERLVTAISHFDFALLGHLRRSEWKAAARHVDLQFLVWLACGIGIGVIVMALLMASLMSNDHTRPLTLATFFGLILASGILVATMIKPATPGQIVGSMLLFLSGCAVALAVYYFTTFGEGSGETSDPSLVYLFCCGAIAICAMILPGISGAMILLLLGVYVHVAHIPKDLVHRVNVVESLQMFAVFGAGCVIGLLCFSKVLRHLLTHFHTPTMALMCGFIFGALPKLWPFQEPLLTQEQSSKKHFHPVLPDSAGQVLTAVGIALVAMAFVFAVDWFARTRSSAAHASPEHAPSSENNT